MKNSYMRCFPIITIILLCAQLALLWLQGSLLNRQKADLASIRHEIRELAALINETLTIEDGGYTTPVSGLEAPSKPSHLKLATMQDDGAIRNELEKSRESARDAVRQAREAQEQLSLSENVKKTEEKAEAKKEEQPWPRRAGIGVLAALIALVIGVWLKKREK